MWRESIRGKNVLRERNGRERIGLKERFFIGGEKLKGEEKLSQGESISRSEIGGVYIEISKSKNTSLFLFLKKIKKCINQCYLTYMIVFFQ